MGNSRDFMPLTWRIPPNRSPPNSGPNLDGRSIGNRRPDFVHLLVGNGDAAIRPVFQPMRCSHPAITVGQPMYVDVTPRGNAVSPRRGTIPIVRVRNVNRFIEMAMRIARIENISPFGGLVVSLAGLRSDWVSTERDPVSFEYFAFAHQLERSFLLQHKNPVRP